MDWTLEVVLVPVSDLDRSIAFYRDRVGFDLDHDTRTEQMHVAQLTPRGSGCSIVLGDLPAHREMAPGSLRGVQDGGTLFGFTDPDGNTWAVQQLKVRGEKPLIPVEYRGRFG